MEDHFSRVLNPRDAANSMEGKRETKDAGAASSTNPITRIKSRKRTIDQIVDEAEDVEVDELNESNLKSMLQLLEKRIQQNELKRMKYADKAEKFMESEMALNGILVRLKAVGAEPALFPFLAKHEVNGKTVLSMLFGLLSHENMDICCEVLSILADWTDPDSTEGFSAEGRDTFVRQLISTKANLDMIVQALFRLSKSVRKKSAELENSKSSSELQEENIDIELNGIFQVFQVLENTLESPDEDISQYLCSKTCLLKFLLNLLQDYSKKKKGKASDSQFILQGNMNIVVYASELVSILLQTNLENVKYMSPLMDIPSSGDDNNKEKSTRKGTDGLDLLLQVFATYRKPSAIASADDEECIGNVTNALCTLLTNDTGNNFKDQFRRLEGFELLIRCMKERCAARSSALRLLDHAILSHKKNAVYFIRIGGLQYLFPLFMGKLKTPKMKSMERERRAVSAIFSIFEAFQTDLQTSDSEPEKDDVVERFYAKFYENDFAKSDRVVELLELYLEKYKGGLEDELDVLYVLQRCAFITAQLTVISRSMKAHVLRKLQEKNVGVESIRKILSYFAASIGISEPDQHDPDGSEESTLEENNQAVRQRKLISDIAQALDSSL